MTLTPSDSDLAEHGRFVRRLAWRLLRDEDLAEEVVQETMLAAVAARPDTSRPMRPWLATVARNVIRRRFRGEGRRRRREEVAAKPEQLPPTVDLAARAEMLRTVVDAVLALDEPNRSAILLRYYEDLPPREIATRLGIGVEAVRGRIKRAIHQLRARLDRSHPAGRAGWAPLLAGLCGYEVPAGLLGTAAGAEAATVPAGTTAASAAPVAAATSSLAIAASFVVGAGLAGLGLWAATDVGAGPAGQVRRADLRGPSLSQLSAPRAEPAPPPAELQGRPEAADRLASLEARRGDLLATLERLRAQLARLDPPRPEGAFRFGIPERAPVFDQTDWKELARHLRAMSAELQTLVQEQIVGESPSAALVARIQKHNLPLATFAVTAGSEMGLDLPNAAFTHPAVVGNLIAAVLELAELPLSPAQWRQIQTLGEVAVAEADVLRGRLAPDASALSQLVVEVEAKHRYLDAVKGVLTAEQRRAAFAPEAEDRVEVDLLSPALLYQMRDLVEAPDVDSLGQMLVKTLVCRAGFCGDDLSAYDWVARAWVDNLAPQDREPRDRRDRDLYFAPLPALHTWARAQARATEQILAMGGLEASVAKRLGQTATIFVPRIASKAPESE